jgi:hypothetical protein
MLHEIYLQLYYLTMRAISQALADKLKQSVFLQVKQRVNACVERNGEGGGGGKMETRENNAVSPI